MTIPHHDPQRAITVTEQVREFIDEVVLPVERALPPGERAPADLVEELRQSARDRGLYAPQMPEELGGLGLDLREALPVYEESGRSYLAQPALRMDAPDEGTMHLLELLATDEQRERWLRPLVDADLVSAFAMTEPMQGGGADPTMVKTTAERDGDEWVLDGHKWWITNGSEADFFVVMARTDPDVHPYEGSSMLIVPADTPGIEVVRDLPTLGGGPIEQVHSELLFEDVRIPEDHVLGEVGDGFAHAQKRMVPARLTQCMRNAGKARRALDIAEAFMSEREVFGDPVAEKQAPRFDIADAETRLRAARLLSRDAARAFAEGGDARVEASMAKYYTTNVAFDVIDTAIQFCGGNGVGKDLPLSDLLADARIIRIADGPDEVQKRVIARDAFEDVDEREVEHLSRFGDPRRPS